MRRSVRRGAVLVVVLGILSVLSLLAVSFSMVAGMERQIARSYLDEVRARLLARSGMEHAMAELRQLAGRQLTPASGPQPWRYWGDDVSENGSGPVNVPVWSAKNPSFAIEGDGNPLSGPVASRQVRVEGAWRGFSGVMESGTYARHGDQFVLKVTDASGKIFINEGVSHSRGNNSTASRNLRRILNRLGAAAVPPLANLGDRVVDNRPAGGYRSVSEVRAFLSESEYSRVQDFLTAYAWVDPNVANPVPYSAARAQAIRAEFGIEFYRGNPEVYRFGRGKDYRGNPIGGTLQVYPATSPSPFETSSLTHAVYAMDELNPIWIEVTSRAPVNPNVAAREVLVALLSDLRGVFMSERRRNNIETTVAGGYHYYAVSHSYSQAIMPPSRLSMGAYRVPEGDELGFLYETYPIVGPGSSYSGIPAARVADEIVACRERRVGLASRFDYAVAPFGGPFRTWRQFYAFCDNLVTQGVLEDPRPIFLDHRPGPISPGNITGYTPLVASNFQRRVASQAIADVLKANFNPNLHLNELNPDRNLFLLVDKTDLVVNSTEFVFTPTGLYDVESIGRVLRPVEGNDALAAGVDNVIVAEAEVRAGLKLFDLVRETSQSGFIQGQCSRRTAGSPTNNNLSLETGPEPDNGRGPEENRWGGYVGFPTMGGNLRVTGVEKPSGTLLPTPEGASEFGETIHTHLSGDCDAHYHKDRKRMDLGSRDDVDPTERVQNYPDPDPHALTVRGPYDPVDNGGNYYRLARAFSLSATGTLPTLTVRAPMDLRLDGAYVERHSGLAYWVSPQSYVPGTHRKQGVISYWVKPSFFPERSGKPRLYADMSRRSARRPQNPPWIEALGHFTNFWNAGHNSLPGTAPTDENRLTWGEPQYWSPGSSHFGVSPFKPESMLFGVGYGWNGGHIGGNTQHQCMQTSSLNHEAHGHPGTSLFKGHEWTHIVLVWSRAEQPQWEWLNVPSSPRLDYKILVNGRVPRGSLEMQYGPFSDLDRDDWTLHENGDRNSIRFGSPSLINREGPHINNFSADSTLDEIYFWNERLFEGEALRQWLMGRYSYPKTADEGVFTSRPVALSGPARRSLPPPSSVVAPGEAPVPPPPAAGLPVGARVLGIAWTWFAEPPTVGPNGWVPTLADHGSAGGTLHPTVEAWLPGIAPTSVTDDGYSALKDSSGNPPRIPADSTVRYAFRIRVPGTRVDTILLATPVVDDVTLYVEVDESPFTYYHLSVMR